MAVYDFHCSECKGKVEKIQSFETDAPVCCGSPMERGPGSVAMLRVKGTGYPARRKWMNDWTPDSGDFSTGSLHGERY